MKEKRREEKRWDEKEERWKRGEMKKRRDDEREEARQDQDKMKRDRNEKRWTNPKKMFHDPQTPPDELAENVSKKKNPRRTNYSSIFLQKFRIWPFFHLFTWFEFDFRAREINSVWVSGCTVHKNPRSHVEVAGDVEVLGPSSTSLPQDFGDILDECLMYIQVFAAVWRTHGHGKNWSDENSCTSLFRSPRPLHFEKRSETTNVASPALLPWQT